MLLVSVFENNPAVYLYAKNCPSTEAIRSKFLGINKIFFIYFQKRRIL